MPGSGVVLKEAPVDVASYVFIELTVITSTIAMLTCMDGMCAVARRGFARLFWWHFVVRSSMSMFSFASGVTWL